MSNVNELKNNLYVLIGLPGSGKSTYAQKLQQDLQEESVNCVIVSTDSIREELFGDASDNHDNSLIFKTAYNRIVSLLNNNFHVIFDDTNLTLKNRAKLFEVISPIRHKIDVVGILFKVPFDVCCSRNLSRDRVVPMPAMWKMLSSFQFPLVDEGFNRLIYKNNFEYRIDVYPLLSMAMDFKESNIYHTNTLYRHLTDCYYDALTLDDCDCLSTNYLPTFRRAALLHDVGKLCCGTEGGKHFINHSNIGAYMSMFFATPADCCSDNVTILINYHMLPFDINKMSPSKVHFYKNVLSKYWEQLILLHNIDIHNA